MSTTRLLWPALVLVLVPGLVSCGDGETTGSAAPTSTAPVTTSTSATEEPEPEPTEEVALPTGPEASIRALSLRLPDFMEVTTEGEYILLGRSSKPLSIDKFSVISLDLQGDRYGPDQALRERRSLVPSSKRLAERGRVVVDGVEMYLISGRLGPRTSYVLGTAERGFSVTIEFLLDRRRGAARNQRIVDSVLASVRLNQA